MDLPLKNRKFRKNNEQKGTKIKSSKNINTKQNFPLDLMTNYCENMFVFIRDVVVAKVVGAVVVSAVVVGLIVVVAVSDDEGLASWQLQTCIHNNFA